MARERLAWVRQLQFLQRIPEENSLESFNKRSSVTSRGGRPYSYSPMEIEQAMWRYFYQSTLLGLPFTMTGMCFAIGISRKGLWNLEKSENSQFLHTIKKGRQIIEMYWENELYQSSNPFKAIFLLKRMGWK